jgi:chromosome segregation ATPase
MRASIQSEELHEIAMEGENAIRKWQSAMEKANQQREEAQKTVDSILYDLNTTLARVQVAQDLFVTEREELWNRWTAFQQGEFSETVRISLKKEQKEKAIALEEAARLRKRVESLEERLKEAEQLLARKEKSVAEVQVIEMEVSKKLQELRTLQLNLDRFQQEIQTKNEVYESWRKRSQEREVQLREEIEERDKKIQTQGYELETNKRRYESLKERLTQVEREFQKTEEVKSRYSELTATVKTHYVHKDEMKRMITIFFDSFAEEIRELERGAEKHEGELQERLDWTESLSGKLEMWVAQIGKFVTFEEKQVSESVTVESVTIETNVETTQVQSQTETSNASASSVASSVVSTAD